jgi:hypothetical protein
MVADAVAVPDVDAPALREAADVGGDEGDAVRLPVAVELGVCVGVVVGVADGVGVGVAALLKGGDADAVREAAGVSEDDGVCVALGVRVVLVDALPDADTVPVAVPPPGALPDGVTDGVTDGDGNGEGDGDTGRKRTMPLFPVVTASVPSAATAMATGKLTKAAVLYKPAV